MSDPVLVVVTDNTAIVKAAQEQIPLQVAPTELDDMSATGATANHVLTANGAGAATWAAQLVTSVAGRTGAITLATGDISGLGGAATLNVGTSAGTVAAGNHTHVSAEITDATSAATANMIAKRDSNGRAEFGSVAVVSGTDTWVYAEGPGPGETSGVLGVSDSSGHTAKFRATNCSEARDIEAPNASGNLALCAATNGAIVAADITDGGTIGKAILQAATVAAAFTQLGIQRVSKNADTNRTSTTYLADSDIILPLEANSEYLVLVFWNQVTNAGNASLKFAYSGTFAASVGSSERAVVYWGSSTGSLGWNGTTPEVVFGAGSATTPFNWGMLFTIRTANAGNFAAWWSAGNGAGGLSGDVTALAGCRMIAIKMP